ncbi:MAG TPA: amidohydrolase family protein [Solirubrobacteraceae bacterium]|jgi:predicted TIM-barrel fold metal-dependent hydrolase|nr:amidohydrolase family protein [Solirubrobacteraceae bacterium]
MPRIDLHAHVLTPAYEQTLPARRRPPQSPAALERFMEHYEIDAAVVSMGGALESRTAATARTGNEELAELVRAQPRRFGALAIVPFDAAYPEMAAAEATYALDTLGLDGVALFSNHHGTYLGDPLWEELLAELDRRGAYVFVHPATPPNGVVFPSYPDWLFEYPFDTTRAITNLIFTGALDRHANVRLQFAHLGGAAMFLAHRLNSLIAREPEKAAEATTTVMAYLAQQYFDTGLSNNMVALASTRTVAPLAHIVYGSDWPYLAQPAGVDPSEDFDQLPPEDRAKIDHHNAAALVPRLAAAVSGVT